jgi:citrate lyase subunit beta / citryl-CoA lyase
VVRINPMSTAYSEEDVIEIAKVKPDAFMVAKATEEDIEKIDEMLSKIERENSFELGSIKLFPLIETAYSLENVYNIIKSSKRNVGILLGAEDLTADLGIKRTKVGEEIFYARSKVAAICKALKVDAIDTPFTDLNDMEAFIKDIEKAKALGMTGKAAINPRQIDTIHEVFAPSIDEINYSKRVMEAMLEAKSEGKGVFSLDGKMVDAPIMARAETILNKAKIMGLV